MKMIRVYGDDFSALLFEKQFINCSVKEMIVRIESGENLQFIDDNGDEYTCEIEVFNFKGIDPNFINFVRNAIQDYDMAKSDNFYFENEPIK